MNSPFLLPALLLFAGCNLFSLLAFGFDKRRAKTDGRRVSERALCLWALIGGVGASLGIWGIRHKSAKGSFLWKAAPLIAIGTAGWCFGLLKLADIGTWP